MNTPVIIIPLLSITLNTFSKKDVDNFLKNYFLFTADVDKNKKILYINLKFFQHTQLLALI